jgi:hypothetical protein
MSWLSDYLELLECVPLAVRQGCFNHDGGKAHYGEAARQWLNATYPGRWIGRRGTIAWPPRSPDLTPMDGFLVRTTAGARLCTPSHEYRRSRGKNSGCSDDNRYQHVKACSRERRAAHWRLPWDGRRPLRTPIVTTRCKWFDHLTACVIRRWRVYWKLKVAGHVSYFQIDLNKESHQGEFEGEFPFTTNMHNGRS